MCLHKVAADEGVHAASLCTYTNTQRLQFAEAQGNVSAIIISDLKCFRWEGDIVAQLATSNTPFLNWQGDWYLLHDCCTGNQVLFPSKDRTRSDTSGLTALTCQDRQLFVAIIAHNPDLETNAGCLGRQLHLPNLHKL